MKSRNYVFTLNNPEVDIHQWLEKAKATGACAARCQLERGEEGTLHIQGFVQYKSPRSFASIKKQFTREHIEVCKNAFRSWEYCGKSDTRVEGPTEFGPMPKPSKRVEGDTKAFNQAVLEEGPEAMVADGRLSIKDYAKVKHARDLYNLTVATPVSVDHLSNRWYWGPTGTGKSRRAREEAGDDLYIKNPNKWWDGYQSQATVLIDDLQKEHAWMGYYLKIWGDHYPFAAEVKGSTLQARPDRIVVTSNYHPSAIWDDPSILEPILRRFRVEEMKGAPPIVF